MAGNLSLASFSKATELKKRLWFTLGALIVFRLLSFVPLPGIDPTALNSLFQGTKGGVLDFFNMFSGGALQRMSLIALGVTPYITASIIIQLMTSLVPSLASIKKEGESGRKKLNQYTRYGTVLLTAIQGVGPKAAMAVLDILSPAELASPEAVGRYAAERALSRLTARRIPTGHFPVLFEAPLALGLVGALTQAVSGGSLYRKVSFLVDSLGKEIFPKHISLTEDPHIKGAMGSSPFDEEGVRTQARDLVRDGVLQGYLLSTYTARKLGMTTTGNAGGSHNLELTSSLTRRKDDLPAMLRKMGTGLLVTELIGQGVNYLTGDYSRGAFGYWVKDGQIQHAVQEVTIAGNLKDMFAQIVAVGADTITRGSKTTGSILIENMAIAGT